MEKADSLQLDLTELDASPTNELYCFGSSRIEMSKLIQAGQSVCKILLTSGGRASGFLCLLPFEEVEIAGLMTNSHVIGKEELSKADGKTGEDFIFQICFESSPYKEKFTLSRKRNIGRWFADDTLDATFLELKASALMDLAEKGIKALRISTFEPTEQLPVAVVQYPHGGPQQVAFSRITELHDPDFKHTVSTDYGSSGSPVVDVESWTVIGVHKRRSEEAESERYNWAVSMLVVVAGISDKFRLGLKSAMRRKESVLLTPRSPDTDRSMYQTPRAKLFCNAKTLLDAAATGSIEDIREILLQEPELLEQARDKENDSALNIAAYNGHLAVVELLVRQNRESVELRGFLGRTALIQAAEKGRLTVVRFLVEEAKADFHAKGTSDDEPMAIQLAAANGHVNVVAYLLEKQPDFLIDVQSTGSLITRAIANSQVKVLEFFIKKMHVSVEIRGWSGRTPLIQAAENGKLAVVKFLVEEVDADILANDWSMNEDMSHHLAAYFGHIDVVDYLMHVKPNALVYARNKTGDTALNRAAFNGQLQVVEFLVKQKLAYVETRGFLGRTPLIQAAETGQLPVVKFLVEEAGADIYARDTSQNENMAIHLAAYFGQVDVVAYLLARKPDLLEGARTKFDDTAFSRAAVNGQLKMVEFFVKKKRVNVETRDFFGRTPLLGAVQKGHLPIVKFLIEDAGANLYARDTSSDEDMAVHLAAYCGHVDAVAYLIERDKNLAFSRNKNGRTPMFYAKQQNKKDVISLLQSYGDKH